MARLSRGRQGDGHGGAQFLDLLGEHGDLMLGAAAAQDPIGPKIVVGRRIIRHDVPVGDQNVVADRADGLEGAAPRPMA